MVSRESWLDEGLAVLRGEGAAGLRIDRLAARLGLSKGSFYHHFAGISGYRLDLLDHYERRFTGHHIAAAEPADDAASISAIDRLDRLRASVLDDPAGGAGLDSALRAWATYDDDARATMERVDARRLSYLRGLWLEISGDEQEAQDISRAVYLLLVGSYHVVPPMPPGEVDRLWDVLLAATGRLS